MEPIGQALVICDAIHKDPTTGKSFLLGTFSAIRAKQFPATHPRLAIYAAITEFRGKTPIEVRILKVQAESDDMDEVARVEGVLDVPDPLMTAELSFTLRNIVFPGPGEYRLHLESNGVILLARRFVVMAIAEGEQ